MAEVAMQLERRIRRGRVAASKSSADRLEGPSGLSTFADITFFFWAETLDEETAEQRVAALVGSFSGASWFQHFHIQRLSRCSPGLTSY